MSLRAKHRSAARQNPLRPLTVVETADLNEQRALPADHPSSTKDDPILAPLKTSLHAIHVVERSGVVPYLERRLRSHPGKKSELSVTALLVAMVLAALLGASYRRTDLCAVLNGLEAQAAFDLGLCYRNTREPLSYNVVAKQCVRLEKALGDSWLDGTGTECDLDWFAHCLIKANLSSEQVARITAVALDSTFARTHAVSYRYAEGENRPQPASADPDATWGHRSATGKRKSCKDLGYNTHIVSTCRSSNWKGRTANANLGPDEPLFPLHLKLVTANSSDAQAGVDTVAWAEELGCDIKEVITDRGFSAKPKNFNRVLHKRGINVVMDYKKETRLKVRELCLGRNDHRLIENCGTFFPVWLGEYFRTPPEGVTGDELTEWYDERAAFRYSPTQRFEGGSIQFECPQCAGRITTKKKTRNKNVKPNEKPKQFTRKDAAKYCCAGKVTIPVEELDYYQTHPYGTTAWKDSYRRRPQIENFNGILRDKGGLEPGWCRAFGRAPRNVASLMLAVAYMMRQNKQTWDTNDTDPSTADDEHNNSDLDTRPASGEDAQSVERTRDGPQ